MATVCLVQSIALYHNCQIGFHRPSSQRPQIKETLSSDFRPPVFKNQTIPSRSLIHALKYFRTSLRIRRDVNKYVLSRAMRHSAGPWSSAMQNNAGPWSSAMSLCHIARDHGPTLCRIARDHGTTLFRMAQGKIA
jgi:hypothetical protein